MGPTGHLTPRQLVPELSLPLAGGGRWRLSDQKPEHFTMLAFYRGMHCSVCSRRTSKCVTIAGIPVPKSGSTIIQGPVILVVLDGEHVEEIPAGRNVLGAGQAFWRSAHGRHNVKNMSSGTARALAIHFDPIQ